MPSKDNYKDKLKRILKMKSANALAIYERGKLLVEVFEDRDFRADAGNVDDFRAADMLDRYLDDTPYGFFDVRQMLLACPERDLWETRPLRELYDTSRQRSKPEQGERKPRFTVTKKEVEDLTVAKQAAESQAAYFEKQLGAQRQSYDELLAENRELRRKLHIAEGRIAELEKLLQKEYVS